MATLRINGGDLFEYKELPYDLPKLRGQILKFVLSEQDSERPREIMREIGEEATANQKALNAYADTIDGGVFSHARFSSVFGRVRTVLGIVLRRIMLGGSDHG